MITETYRLGRVRWIWQLVRFQIYVIIWLEGDWVPDSIFDKLLIMTC